MEHAVIAKVHAGLSLCLSLREFFLKEQVFLITTESEWGGHYWLILLLVVVHHWWLHRLHRLHHYVLVNHHPLILVNVVDSWFP